jgi:hypothetical protein
VITEQEQEKLSEIANRVQASTGGKWESYDNYVNINGTMIEVDTGNPFPGDSSNDTELIANAKEDLHFLLELVKRLANG